MIVKLSLVMVLLGGVSSTAFAEDFEWGSGFIKSLEGEFNARNGHPNATDSSYVHFCTGTTLERENCALDPEGDGTKRWRIGERAAKGPFASTPQPLAPSGWESPADHTTLNPWEVARVFPEIKSSDYAKGKLCVLILEHEFKHTSSAKVGGALVGGKTGEDAEDNTLPEPCDHLKSYFELIGSICNELTVVLSDSTASVGDRCAAAAMLCRWYAGIVEDLIYTPGNEAYHCDGIEPTVGEGEFPPICALCVGQATSCGLLTGVAELPESVGTDYGRLGN